MNEKEKLILQLQNTLGEKINALQKEIESTKESRNNDTKSSAGDKFETGREMMQIEIGKNEVQLHKTLKLKKELSQIDTNKSFKKVDFGSLVLTDNGNYFMAIGIGKVIVGKEDYYVISLASPIGQVLQDKKVGDSFQFQNRTISIQKIL